MSSFPGDIVALHRPSSASGVSVTAARLAKLPAPARPWGAMVIGEHGAFPSDFPARSLPGCSCVEWDANADAVAQVRVVRDALRARGTRVIVPNDLPHGFIVGALEHHRGVRVAAWIHGDDEDADELFLRFGHVMDAFRPVSAGVRTRAERCGVLVSPFAPPLSACVEVGDACPPPRHASEHADLAGERLKLLFVGLLSRRHKRVMDLIALADALHELGVEFQLGVVGGGPAEGEFARRAWDHIRAGRIAMYGRLPLALIPAINRAHDMLVLVSQSEGMPNVVMEAWAQGRPTALSDACGRASELLTDGRDGFVFPVGNMVSLAHRLAACDRASLGRMGAAAHGLARRACSLEALAPKYEAFVREAEAAPERPRDARALRTRWDAIRAGLEMIGPCSRESLVNLRDEWLADLGVADPGLEATLPGLPGREARQLLRAIDELRGKQAQRIALYGAGWHTRKLAPFLDRCPEVIAILDDRATPNEGRRIGDVPILPPDATRGLKLDAIVISSDEHEREMLARAGTFRGDVPVVTLYQRAG